MVCPGMGLLDDAIRDHLELKRRRGADPSEVARQQRAVLDSESAEDVGDAAVSAVEASAAPESEVPAPVHEEQMLLDDAPAGPEDFRSGHADLAPDASLEPVEEADTVQETVELDMQRELSGDAQGASGPPEHRSEA
jgi:hypothetical protein